MLDCIVIGGGQAGLAAAYYLKQHRFNFIIIDDNKNTGDAWRNRYDSLYLFTPRKFNSLPGLHFEGEAHGLPHKDEVAQYLNTYAQHFDFPIQHGTQVTSLSLTDQRFEVSTSEGNVLQAKHVIVATGPFQKPFIPGMEEAVSDTVIQLHSSDYRNMNQLQKGSVLVVGAGNSGAQIACELAEDFEVHLSASSSIHIRPLHIFRKSIFTYFNTLGMLTANRKSKRGKWLYQQPEYIYGEELRTLLQKGAIKLHARTKRIADQHVYFEDDDIPVRVDNIIWATGYRRDHQWINITEAFHQGEIVHQEGVSVVPGLYFVGLPWQTSRGSALLGWVQYDAKRIVERMLE